MPCLPSKHPPFFSSPLWQKAWILLTDSVFCFSMFAHQCSLTFIVPIFPVLFWDRIFRDVDFPRAILRNCSHDWTFRSVRSLSVSDLRHLSCVSLAPHSPEWTLVLNGTFIDLYNHVVLRVGLLGAAPYLSYLLVIPLVRPLIRRVGVCSVTLTGSVIVFFALLPPAFGVSLELLAISRLVHGVGFVLTVVGMTSRITDIAHSDLDGRYWLPAAATTACSCGAALGPVVGGAIFEVAGLRLVYACILCIVVVDITGQIVIFDSDLPRPFLPENPRGVCDILKDGYALLALLSLGLLSSVVGLIIFFVPLWMIEMLQLPTWQLGFIILPVFVFQVFGNGASSLASQRLALWQIDLAGFVLSAVAMLVLPMAQRLYQVLLVMAAVGLTQGFSAAALIPILTTIVDRRHAGAYVTLYDLTERVDQLGMVVGPLLGILLLRVVAFPWIMRVFCFILVAWALVQIVLRDRSGKEAEERGE